MGAGKIAQLIEKGVPSKHDDLCPVMGTHRRRREPIRGGFPLTSCILGMYVLAHPQIRKKLLEFAVDSIACFYKVQIIYKGTLCNAWYKVSTYKLHVDGVKLVCWPEGPEVHPWTWLTPRQLDAAAKLERKVSRMFEFPFPEASASAEPTVIINLKTHMITVNICWFRFIGSITFAWRPYSHIFLKEKHFLLSVNLIWMSHPIPDMCRWIESCLSWVLFPWPLGLIWDSHDPC